MESIWQAMSWNGQGHEQFSHRVTISESTMDVKASL